MSALETAKELLVALPVGAIGRERMLLLRDQIETMEGRLKLADDRVKHAEEKSARLEGEMAFHRAELVALREQVALAGLTEEYEQRGPFVYKRGDSNPRCPNCKSMLSVTGSKSKCTSCPWHHEEHHTISVGTISFRR
jgi:hypothetical protein